MCLENELCTVLKGAEYMARCQAVTVLRLLLMEHVETHVFTLWFKISIHFTHNLYKAKFTLTDCH